MIINTWIRIGGSTLEENACSAVGERRVDDVRVTGDPADVGDAAEDVVLVVIAEDVLVAECCVQEVAGRAVSDPFWSASTACRIFYE